MSRRSRSISVNWARKCQQNVNSARSSALAMWRRALSGPRWHIVPDEVGWCSRWRVECGSPVPDKVGIGSAFVLGTRFSSSGSGSMAQRRRVGRCLPVPDKVGQRSTALPRLPLFQGVGAALWRIKSIGSLVAAQSHNLGDGSCVIDILSCLRKRSSKCGQSAAGRRSIKACSKQLRPLAHCR